MGYISTEASNASAISELNSIDPNDKIIVDNNGTTKNISFKNLKSNIGGATLKVSAMEGSTITVSDSNVSYSKQGEIVVFEIPYYGTWTVTVTKNGKSNTKTVVIDQAKNYEISYVYVYGISRDQNSSSPEWTRTDDAVGFEATASVGAVAGSSDFDNLYPWSDMKRYNVVGASGANVMVYIPPFYYKREVSSEGIETVQISNGKIKGFELHPGSGSYVGAYVMNSSMKSSLDDTSYGAYRSMRSYSNSIKSTNGNSWGLWSIMQRMAIEMLYLVEYADNDSQTKIGYGCNSGNGTMGECDQVPGLTGRPVDNSHCNTVYRGIEALWGGMPQKLDGAFSEGTDIYICIDPSLFANNTTNYTKLSYTTVSPTSSTYISKMGYDPDNSWAMFACEANGSSTTGYCDDVRKDSSGLAGFVMGSIYGRSGQMGLFSEWKDYSIAHSNEWIGARVAYYPQLDTENTLSITEWTVPES